MIGRKKYIHIYIVRLYQMFIRFLYPLFFTFFSFFQGQNLSFKNDFQICYLMMLFVYGNLRFEQLCGCLRLYIIFTNSVYYFYIQLYIDINLFYFVLMENNFLSMIMIFAGVLDESEKISLEIRGVGYLRIYPKKKNLGGCIHARMHMRSTLFIIVRFVLKFLLEFTEYPMRIICSGQIYVIQTNFGIFFTKFLTVLIAQFFWYSNFVVMLNFSFLLCLHFKQYRFIKRKLYCVDLMSVGSILRQLPGFQSQYLLFS
eukprot:TRINITY_DN50518_c0_g1_i1.p2 TRINITY_DN50518_c0_g1~~TRINITY_DN50518_c0_g1_i1.p2  ORF type:complete len:257 (-),score=-11.68 TRINITY_DN50518_c0_g1_i1:306-1076(-)